MRRRCLSAGTVAAGAMLSLIAAPVAAQSVQGLLRQAADSAPVAGALVLLLDSAGVERGRSVSYTSGRYAVTAGAPGRYRLQVLRIGSRPYQTPAFALAARQVLALPVLLPSARVVLSEIVVAADSRCRLHPEADAVMEAVWQEVRKAIDITVETMRHGPYRFATELRHQRFDPDMLLIREDSEPGPQLQQWPVASLPPDSLARSGYVQPGSLGMGPIYYGIDPALLFSASFLDRHCFYLVQNRDAPGLIGLAFEPAGRPSHPDVQGTLWLSRANDELRYLEWSYTRLDSWVPQQKTGGRLDFMRLDNGAWLVRNWWMRAPMREDRDRGHHVVGGWVVQGGRVTDVRDRQGQVLQQVPLPGD